MREIVKLLNRENVRFVKEGRLGTMVETSVNLLRKLPFKFKFTVATPIPVSIEVQESQDSKEDSSAPDSDADRARLIQGMYGILANILPENVRLRILIDELDEAWKARREQTSSIAGLLSAVMRMRAPFVELDLEDRITVLIFLRADIYEVLKRDDLGDASKYRRHELHLRWNPATLRSVLDRRIEAAGIPRMKTMRDLFTNERISRRALDGHLLSWITPRPRDLITIMQMCLENADRNSLISKADVDEAMTSYSSWRESVILEETRYGLEGASDLLDSFKNGESEYTPKELRAHLDNVKREHGIQLAKPKIIDMLVNAGFLGVMDKTKGTTLFMWDVPARQSLGPHETKGSGDPETWIIHPSLWRAFDITQRPSAKPTAKASS